MGIFSEWGIQMERFCRLMEREKVTLWEMKDGG